MRVLINCLSKLPLFVFCLLLCWSGCVGRVEAEEEPYHYVGTFEYNGVGYPYYYVGSFQVNISGTLYNFILDYPVYGFRLDNSFTLVDYSDANKIRKYRVSDGVDCGYDSFFYNNKYGIYVGGSIYGGFSGSSLPNSGTYGSDALSIKDAFYSFFKSDDFVEYKAAPLWSKATSAQWFSLSEFEAAASDTDITLTWNGVQGTDSMTINTYENTYVRVMFLLEADGTVEGLEDDAVFHDDFVKISDNEFVLEKDLLDIPDGYEIVTVMAIPYYHFLDDVENTLYRGQASVVNITVDGDFGSAIIRNPDDIYDADNPDKSNWDAITNFTGDFFLNMDDMINDYDNQQMEEDNERLHDGLGKLKDAEGTVMDDSVSTLDGYDFTTSLTFTAGLVNALAYCKGFVDRFFTASGDLTVIVTVAFAMVFISIVAGIFRFASGRKK